MNRRMVKAKAARKWHAAHQRQVRRIIDGAMARMTDSLADSIRAHADLGTAMRDAARAAQGFIVETVVRHAVRQVVASLPRFHSGGFVSGGMVRPGEVPAVILPGGQLYMRERGSSEPMRHVGTTGPIALRLGIDPLPGQGCTCTFTRVVKTDSQGQPHHVDLRSPPCDWCERHPPMVLPECGACGEPLRPDAMTGTTCGCAPARRPFLERATSTWNGKRCTCEPNPDGDRCEYCDGWLAGQA